MWKLSHLWLPTGKKKKIRTGLYTIPHQDPRQPEHYYDYTTTAYTCYKIRPKTSLTSHISCKHYRTTTPIYLQQMNKLRQGCPLELKPTANSQQSKKNAFAAPIQKQDEPTFLFEMNQLESTFTFVSPIDKTKTIS